MRSSIFVTNKIDNGIDKKERGSLMYYSGSFILMSLEDVKKNLLRHRVDIAFVDVDIKKEFNEHFNSFALKTIFVDVPV